jgi:hypothetical protein
MAMNCVLLLLFVAVQLVSVAVKHPISVAKSAVDYAMILD